MSTPYDPYDPQQGHPSPQHSGGGRPDAEPTDPYARPEGTPGQHQVPPTGSASQGAAAAYGGPPAYPGGQQAYGGPQYAPMPYGGGYGYAPNRTEANSLGIWALSLGIASILIFGLLTGIPAIVMGHKARRAAAEGRADNGGFGLAGIILGWVSVVLSVIGVVLLVAVFSSPEFRAVFEESYGASY